MNPNAATLRFEKLEDSASYIDAPAPDAPVYGESVTISGWLHARGRDPARCRIRAWCDGATIGETQLMFIRDDVSRALNISEAIPTGFRLLALLPNGAELQREAQVSLSACWDEAATEYEFARTTVQLVPALLAQRPFAGVITPDQRTVLHRENIYGSGPPVSEPGAETLYLIQQYLGPRESVLDVGCGAGAYGPSLINAGHEWLGLEVNAGCVELLRARHLPHRQVNDEAGSLPCADDEFDNAICVEVLEHIAQPERFLAEIARAVRRRALFSVPNIEVIPYFSVWQVVPWHLLEADHKNFFTRASLRELLRKYFRHVEVFSYAEHPLRTPDGVALHVHLFAVADK